MSALDEQIIELVALTGAEQNAIVEVLRATGTAEALGDRLQFGIEPASARDELIMLDDRKRLLAAETRRVNARMETLRERLDEEWRERGITSERGEDGVLLHRTRGRVFAKVVRPEGQKDIDPQVKQAACDALKAAELGDYVAEDFSTASVGSYFRELSDAYDAEQRLLPEHERTPKDINDFLPDQLHGLIELTDNPTISIKRS